MFLTRSMRIREHNIIYKKMLIISLIISYVLFSSKITPLVKENQSYEIENNQTVPDVSMFKHGLEDQLSNVSQYTQKIKEMREEEFSRYSYTRENLFKSPDSNYTTIIPISIRSNADFPIYANSGDGTKSNPWVISYLNISGKVNTDKENLILINGTTDFFILENNYLTDASGSGIYLVNVINGKINNNVIINTVSGISLESVRDIIIENNKITGLFGVTMAYSQANQILNNTIINSFLSQNYGLYLIRSFDNIIKFNDLRNTSMIITGNNLNEFLQKEVSGNLIDGRPLIYWQNINDQSVPENAAQVFIINSSGIDITKLKITKKFAAISIIFSSDIIIRQNILSNSSLGLYIQSSSEIRISGNQINSAIVRGLEIGNSEGIYIYNNSIKNSYFEASHIFDSTNVYLQYNSFQNSLLVAVNIESSQNVILRNNNFINNNLDRSQAVVDQASTLIEFTNNYWNDWVTPDNNNDGIVDLNYKIPVNSSDFYPMVNYVEPKDEINIEITSQTTSLIIPSSNDTDSKEESTASLKLDFNSFYFIYGLFIVSYVIKPARKYKIMS